MRGSPLTHLFIKQHIRIWISRVNDFGYRGGKKENINLADQAVIFTKWTCPLGFTNNNSKSCNGPIITHIVQKITIKIKRNWIRITSSIKS